MINFLCFPSSKSYLSFFFLSFLPSPLSLATISHGPKFAPAPISDGPRLDPMAIFGSPKLTPLPFRFDFTLEVNNGDIDLSLVFLLKINKNKEIQHHRAQVFFVEKIISHLQSESKALWITKQDLARKFLALCPSPTMAWANPMQSPLSSTPTTNTST